MFLCGSFSLKWWAAHSLCQHHFYRRYLFYHPYWNHKRSHSTSYCRQNWGTHPSTSINFIQWWVLFWVKSAQAIGESIFHNSKDKSTISHSPSKYFLPASAVLLQITPKMDPSLLALSTSPADGRRLATHWRIHEIIRRHGTGRSHGNRFHVIITRAFCFVCLPCGCFLIQATAKEYCIKDIYVSLNGKRDAQSKQFSSAHERVTTTHILF